MSTRGLVVAALVAFSVSGFVSHAWAEKGDMRVQFGALFSMPTDDLVEGNETTEADDAFGFQVAFEYMASDKIGIEPALGFGSHDITFIEPGFPDIDIGDIDWLALTANVNFHLMREKDLDLYIGPTVGYAFWGDLKSDFFMQDFATDDEFVYGLNFGLDVPFGGGSWEFSGALNYLFVDFTPEGGSADIGVDPVQLKAGLSYRF